MGAAVKAVIVKNGKFLIPEQVVEEKTRYSLSGFIREHNNLKTRLVGRELYK